MIDDTELAERIRAADKRLRNWCVDRALPLWASAARTPEGGFYEHLLPDGRPDTAAPVRIRVNARQTYAYAHATCLGWYAPGLDIANDCAAFMQRYCMAGDSASADGDFTGLAYILSTDNCVIDGRVDLYTQAFYLLAMAYLHRAGGGDAAVSAARSACTFLDREMASPHGGWIESLPAGSAHALPRRQNPHMHLFEAFMALYEASGERVFLDKADHIYDLFVHYFHDRKTGVLLEFFTEDWSRDSHKGNLIEPGHMMEWAWLLSVYARIKRIDLSDEIRSLHAEALARGLNPETGLLWDEMQIDGTVTKPTHRSWSMTEYLKASIALADLGDREAAATIPGIVDRLFAAYLETDIPGGWHDQRDADGRIISDTMPTSTFYHYVCACAELSRFAAKTGADQASSASR